MTSATKSTEKPKETAEKIPEALFFMDGRKMTLYRMGHDMFRLEEFPKKTGHDGTFTETLSRMLTGRTRKRELIFKGLPDWRTERIIPEVECRFQIGTARFVLQRNATAMSYTLFSEHSGAINRLTGNLYDLALIIYESHTFEEIKHICELAAPEEKTPS